MAIRKKIAARNAEHKAGDGLNKALLRMAGIIFAGYAIGTVIALFIERLK